MLIGVYKANGLVDTQNYFFPHLSVFHLPALLVTTHKRAVRDFEAARLSKCTHRHVQLVSEACTVTIMHLHAQMHTYTHKHTRTHTHARTHIHTRVHTHIHTHTHTQTHTHTHTLTLCQYYYTHTLSVLQSVLLYIHTLSVLLCSVLLVNMQPLSILPVSNTSLCW